MTDVEPLSPGDALFVDIESEVNAMYVGACLVFERAPLEDSSGVLDFERLMQFISARVADQDRYHQVIERTPLEGRLVWSESDDFDIRQHVDRARLDEGSGERELKSYCARFVREPIETNQPMWAIRIVEGFADRRFALVIKAHHSLVDGIAGITLLGRLLTVDPQHKAPRVASHRPHRRTTWLDKFSVELKQRRTGIERLIEDGIASVRHPRDSLAGALDRSAGFLQILRDQLRPVSHTPLEGRNTVGRTLDWMQTPLDRIAEIRRRRGGTLNDVVTATVALALGRYLEGEGISRSEQRRMEIRIAVPVNMRGAENEKPLGNQISMLFAKIPVGETDPLCALDETRESLARAKASGAADALGSVLDLGEWAPRPVTRWLTRLALSTQPANLVLTNIPGPPQPLFLLEAQLLEIHPVVPLMPGHTLAIAVLSYAGQLDWGFHADPNGFPDTPRFAEQVRVAFEDLEHAVNSSDLAREQAHRDGSNV